LQAFDGVGDLLQLLDQRVGRLPLPGRKRLGDELLPVREVPIEAALGRPEPGGESLDRYLRRPAIGERLQRRLDPVLPA
jgi:hypothetical protein